MTPEAWKEQAAQLGPFKLKILNQENYGGEHREWHESVTLPRGASIILEIAEALYPLVQQTIAAEREALNGYRAAVAFISADSWDGCSDCIEILHAARNADLHHDLTDPNDVAENLKRIRLHGAAAIRSLKESDNGAG